MSDAEVKPDNKMRTTTKALYGSVVSALVLYFTPLGDKVFSREEGTALEKQVVALRADFAANALEMRNIQRESAAEIKGLIKESHDTHVKNEDRIWSHIDMLEAAKMNLNPKKNN